MSKPDTWMPLYIGDYMADTMHLSTEQHGAYLLLLLTAWNRGGKLPNDEAQLALICRADKKSWARISGAVLPFFEVDGAHLVQGRLLAEYERAVKLNAKQKANGKLGGRPKKNPNESQNKPVGFDRDNPNNNPNETPSPSPSQNPTSSVASSVPSTAPATSAGMVCARLRQAGVASVNPSHPRLLALLDAGMSENELADLALEPASKGKGFAWLLAAAEGRRREAAGMGVLPPAGASHAATVAKQRDEVLTVLTGKGKANERDITGEAVRVA